MPEQYDVIVVGGGHNGLVAAAYLAQAGRKVLVLERRELVGGPCVTEEVWPGFHVSTAAYLVSLLQDRIVQDLELSRFGYQVLPKDPPFFSPFPDGRYLFLWQDRDKSLAEIAKFSARDAERYPAYEQHLERIAAVIEALLLETPPAMEGEGPEALVEYLRRSAAYPGLTAAEKTDLAHFFTQSAADMLDVWFESDQLKVTLATDGVIGANGGPHSPGTAYILLHHCMGQVAGHRGLWGFVKGGMGGVTQALARSAEARGVTIRVNAVVQQILTREGRVAGVVLEDGTEIPANIVLSNADPKVTFLKLIEERALPVDFLQSIRAFRCEGTSLKMNLALSGLPEFRALPGAPGPQHRATMHLCPTMEYVETAWEDARQGRPSREPLLEMTLPTMYDPDLAPAGRHIMGVFVQYAPYTLREGNWDDLREPYAEQLFNLLEQYVPNLRDIVIDRQVLTPLDLERRFAVTGGNIFHGDMRPDQMFFRRPIPRYAQYRTPIQGLYLCGSGAHPGGGVMGAPGYNAACEVLRTPGA